MLRSLEEPKKQTKFVDATEKLHNAISSESRPTGLNWNYSVDHERLTFPTIQGGNKRMKQERESLPTSHQSRVLSQGSLAELLRDRLLNHLKQLLVLTKVLPTLPLCNP